MIRLAVALTFSALGLVMFPAALLVSVTRRPACRRHHRHATHTSSGGSL